MKFRESTKTVNMQKQIAEDMEQSETDYVCLNSNNSHFSLAEIAK